MNFPRGSTWGWFSLEEPITDEIFEKIKDAKLQANGELQWSRVTGELRPICSSSQWLIFLLQVTRKSNSGLRVRLSRESSLSSKPTKRMPPEQSLREGAEDGVAVVDSEAEGVVEQDVAEVEAVRAVSAGVKTARQPTRNPLRKRMRRPPSRARCTQTVA